jgi:uncharacterized cupin superfamily protein
MAHSTVDLTKQLATTLDQKILDQLKHDLANTKITSPPPLTIQALQDELWEIQQSGRYRNTKAGMFQNKPGAWQVNEPAKVEEKAHIHEARYFDLPEGGFVAQLVCDDFPFAEKAFDDGAESDEWEQQTMLAHLKDDEVEDKEELAGSFLVGSSGSSTLSSNTLYNSPSTNLTASYRDELDDLRRMLHDHKRAQARVLDILHETRRQTRGYNTTDPLANRLLHALMEIERCVR